MIEKLSNGEARPYKVNGKINEVIDELEQLGNELRELNKHYNKHYHISGRDGENTTYVKVGEDDSVTK